MSLKTYIEEEPTRTYTIYISLIRTILIIVGSSISIFIFFLVLSILLKVIFEIITITFLYGLYLLLKQNQKKYIEHVFRLLFHADIDLYQVQWISREFEQFLGSDFKVLNEIYDDYFSLRTALIYGPSVSDYSCLVLPLAKAYEGVLKKILVRAGFITEAQLEENPDISIGRYFNPVGNNAIFNALKDQARDKAIPYVIYSTYQECRNLVLHYDPYRDNRLKTMEDAEFYQRRISDAIKKAFETFQKIKVPTKIKRINKR